jgi:hypothetical protein
VSHLRSLVALAILAASVTAHAQDPAKPDERPTGLPGPISWTFNFDAAWGSFGFQNSLYANPKENVPENLSDQWFEGFVKPALSGSYGGRHGEIFGKISVVGERTYGSAPVVAGNDSSSFQAEDLYIGWRSGETLPSLGKNAVEFTFGRAQYTLGHGFLIYDGNAEGGSRGGYWSNARKAFELAAIGHVAAGPHTAEVFYLDKDELPENDSDSRLWGANYELSVGRMSTFGATYIKTFADPLFRPDRDGMNVFTVRAYTAPVPSAPDLSFEFEYALEKNGEAIDSNAWTLLGAYELSHVAWKPTFSYRYASFAGDDPATTVNESFDPLFLGFHDWGQWWQGEIAGEYFLSNSNLISHMVRAHLAPTDAIGTGLLFFKFTLDQPASFAPGVTANDLAFEVNWYMDWKINHNFTASFVAAFSNPGMAVQQAFDRTKNFTYGMAYLAYAF